MLLSQSLCRRLQSGSGNGPGSRRVECGGAGQGRAKYSMDEGEIVHWGVQGLVGWARKEENKLIIIKNMTILTKYYT